MSPRRTGRGPTQVLGEAKLLSQSHTAHLRGQSSSGTCVHAVRYRAGTPLCHARDATGSARRRKTPKPGLLAQSHFRKSDLARPSNPPATGKEVDDDDDQGDDKQDVEQPAQGR